MRTWSIIGIWVFKNWSLCDHISRADSPRFLMRVLSLAVMRARDRCETTLLSGSNRSISTSSSWIALSATGFLFTFFGRPSSIAIRCRVKSSSFTKALNPGAGSVLMMANGPSRGWTSANSWITASRSSWVRSDSYNLVKVYEVTHSRKTKIICRSRLITSAAKEEPTVSGGSEEICFSEHFGIFCNEAHWWHVFVTDSMALSKSNA